MIGSGTATFTDPGDYQASITGLRLDLVLTGGVDFRARLTWTELRTLRLLHCREAGPRIGFAMPTPDMAVVAFPENARWPQTWGGVTLGSGDMVVLGRDDGLHQWMNGASRWGVVILPAEELAAYGKALMGRALKLSANARILRPPRAASNRLLRLHAKACGLVEARPEFMVHREVVRALEHELCHALINCLTAGDTQTHSATFIRHASLMSRLEAALATHGKRQIGTPELCGLLGVSERTLRICCASILGVSPGSYVRLRRLNHVRRLLIRGDSMTSTVAEIAARFGFTELGRFAAAYRTAFGEMPSVTLRAAEAKKFSRGKPNLHSV